MRTVARVRQPQVDNVAVTVAGASVLLRSHNIMKEYALDAAYDHTTPLTGLFLAEAVPVIQRVAEGHNGTFFTYGATGSGKTFTMMGDGKGVAGLMQMSLCELLRLKQGKRLRCALVELYDEEFYDLLDKRRKVMIRGDERGLARLTELTEVGVSDLAGLEELLESGRKFRQTRSTKLNQRSSRSHALLQISVEGEGGRLFLWDLAGTENNRRTGNEGVALKESKSINLSLFQLNAVIQALQCGDAHVPYRDSKLTRILEDAVGGSSLAVIFACLSPQVEDVGEGLRVLAMTTAAGRIAKPVPVQVPSTPSSSRAKELEDWRIAKGKTPRGSAIKVTPWKNQRGQPGERAETRAGRGLRLDFGQPEPERKRSNAELTEERFLSFVNAASQEGIQRLKHIGPAKAKVVLLLRGKGVLIDSVEELSTSAALSMNKIKESMQDFSMWE